MLHFWKYVKHVKFGHRLLKNMIGCFTCQSCGLLSGPWPFKVAKVHRPSAVSLKILLRKTRQADVCLKSELQEFVLKIAQSSLYFYKIIGEEHFIPCWISLNYNSIISSSFNSDSTSVGILPNSNSEFCMTLIYSHYHTNLQKDTEWPAVWD